MYQNTSKAETAVKFSNIYKICVSAVQQNKVSTTKEWLIQPINNYFDPGNTKIRKISSQTTAQAPRMAEVWPEIESVFRDKTVVIYCGGDVFDNVRHEATTPTSFNVVELLPILKKLWRGIDSYTIKSLCSGLDIPYDRSSKTMADIVIYTITAFGCDNLADLIEGYEQKAFKSKKVA